jgi:hypothetical protein
MEQLTLFGAPEEVGNLKEKGRMDWAPVPWERVRIDGKRVGIRIEDVERAKRIVRKEVADDTQGS